LKLIVVESRLRPARNAPPGAAAVSSHLVNFPPVRRIVTIAAADVQQYGRRGQFGFIAAAGRRT